MVVIMKAKATGRQIQKVLNVALKTGLQVGVGVLKKCFVITICDKGVSNPLSKDYFARFSGIKRIDCGETVENPIERQKKDSSSERGQL